MLKLPVAVHLFIAKNSLCQQFLCVEPSLKVEPNFQVNLSNQAMVMKLLFGDKRRKRSLANNIKKTLAFDHPLYTYCGQMTSTTGVGPYHRTPHHHVHQKLKSEVN